MASSRQCRAAPEPSKGCPRVISHRQAPVPRRRSQRLDVHADQQREHGQRKERVIIVIAMVANARARASIFGGVTRRPASHVRYDSGGTPSMSPRTPPATGPARSGSHAAYRATGLHDVTPCHRRRPLEARGWRRAYFSQPIFGPDRSLFSPAPSPPVPRQMAQSANSLGKWHARQDSNLRPSA